MKSIWLFLFIGITIIFGFKLNKEEIDFVGINTNNKTSSYNFYYDKISNDLLISTREYNKSINEYVYYLKKNKLEEEKWITKYVFKPNYNKIENKEKFINFGKSLAKNKDCIVIGAPLEDNIYQNSGSVYVNCILNNIDDIFSLHKLYPSDPHINQQFGYSVDIFKNDILVTARNGLNQKNVNQGSVYLFKYNIEEDLWEETKLIIPNIISDKGRFGNSIKFCSGFIIISAPNNIIRNELNDEEESTGSIFIFKKLLNDNWELHQTILFPLQTEFENFGNEIKVNENCFIVNCPSLLDKTQRIFEYCLINNQFKLKNSIIPIINEENVVFGYSIDYNGKYYAISTFPFDGNQHSYVYIYAKNNTTTYLKDTIDLYSNASSKFKAEILLGDEKLYLLSSIIGKKDDRIFEVSLIKNKNITIVKNETIIEEKSKSRQVKSSNNKDIEVKYVNEKKREVASRNCIANKFNDCNKNNISDSCDIASGFSSDCNNDGYPDECSIANNQGLDCNNNTILDSCEIATGMFKDCNNNSVIDICDIFQTTSKDCNHDSIPDECQLGTTANFSDCNTNGILDICETSDYNITDCNHNGIYDFCEILAGTEKDCNKNTLPDSCDILSGFSHDCDLNTIPDECQSIKNKTGYDCNNNSILDSCEIRADSSKDCNSNGILDQCEILTGFGGARDCNLNGILDKCEINAGTQHDCDFNNILDVCQISSYGAIDCNSNGLLDICEINNINDCNSDGILDTCEINVGMLPDVNSDGYPDSCVNLTYTDCNHNQIPDNFESTIANLTGYRKDASANYSLLMDILFFIEVDVSFDCNLNGIIDYCDLYVYFTSFDCNNNLEIDTCDIASGYSLDLNTNNIPDECDCNTTYGLSKDCNNNSIADQCELIYYGETDCNSNTILDSCEINSNPTLDCNFNSIIDSCEIYLNASLDCNHNNQIDSCEIKARPFIDCDQNMVIDNCQVSANHSLDCNGNAILDFCDILGSYSLDCNNNSIPDSCDISSNRSYDINHDGIPDECQHFLTTIGYITTGIRVTTKAITSGKLSTTSPLTTHLRPTTTASLTTVALTTSRLTTSAIPVTTSVTTNQVLTTSQIITTNNIITTSPLTTSIQVTSSTIITTSILSNNTYKNVVRFLNDQSKLKPVWYIWILVFSIPLCGIVFIVAYYITRNTNNEREIPRRKKISRSDAEDSELIPKQRKKEKISKKKSLRADV